MRVRRSSTNQQKFDSEWLTENTNFIDKNNEKKYELVSKIFMESYLENIKEGMNPKDALQKAKWVAFCFLMQKER